MADISDVLRDEAEHAEQNKDAVPGDDSTITRPGRDRAKVLSVRLNAAEYERLAAKAALSGVGPSTLARTCILRALDQTEGQGLDESWMASVIQRLSDLEDRVGSAS